MPVTTFRKSATARAIAFEVAGLRDLGAAANAGGVPCATLVDVGETWLETRRLDEGRVSADAAREFGAALARTHAFVDTSPGADEPGPSAPGSSAPGPSAPGADSPNTPARPSRNFGQAPSTFDEAWNFNSYMGEAPLPLVSPTSPPRTFGQFYGQDRLLPYLDLAQANGSIDSDGAKTIERLAERLRDGIFDSPQPTLVKTQAALIHGDLWSGNVLWVGGGSSGAVGTLIDPASHGGHAESDLAQLTVFGQRHIEDIYAGYNAVSPLAEGWRDRIGLHTLHILIVHAALFGGSYGRRTITTARAYL